MVSYLLFVFSFVVAVIHFFLFGFRMSNDGPFWISVSQVFFTGSTTNFGCLHCLENPILPAFLVGLHFLGLNYLQSFAVINIITFFLNPLLLYKLTINLTRVKFVALITAILFIIDFENQYLAFSTMPDSLTWTFLLLVLLSAVSGIKAGYAGLLVGIATLTKTNLLFYTPLFPYLRKKISINFVVGAILLPIVYYLVIAKFFSWLPWDSLVQNSKILTRTPQAFVSSFVSSYLYLGIFIIFGFSRTVFKISKEKTILMILMTMIPIIIWPFYVPRFAFTTFYFLLPLAANGILKLTRASISLVVVFLAFLYLINTLRIYLSLASLSHWQFIQLLLPK